METNESTIETLTEPVRKSGVADRRASGAGNRRQNRKPETTSVVSPDASKSAQPDVVIIGDPAQSNLIDNSQSKDETMTQANETQTNDQTQTTEGQTMQTNDTPSKPVTAFEAMMKARLEFEAAKTKAILQVRELCDSFSIDLRKDVYPESIKPRKPYAKRKSKDATTIPVDASASVQSGTAAPTPSADGVKAPEPALV